MEHFEQLGRDAACLGVLALGPASMVLEAATCCRNEMAVVQHVGPKVAFHVPRPRTNELVDILLRFQLESTGNPP